jgi:hypothetical protein
MARVAVACCLMLATVAEPWLCCCNAGRLAAAARAVARAVGLGAADTPTSSCCGGHAAPSARQSGRPAPYREPVSPSCPLKGSAPLRSTLGAPESTASRQAAEPVDGPNPFAVPVIPRPCCPSWTTSRSAGLRDTAPAGGSRDILSAFQILRC